MLKIFYRFKPRLIRNTVKVFASTNVIINNFESSKNLLSFEDIPGPKSYPVVGTLWKYFPLIGDYDAEKLDRIALLNWRRYGPLGRENPGVRVLHVFDPDLIESVFRQDDRYPSRRSHLAMRHYRLSKTDVYRTGGLLSTNGPEWWRLRSTFQKNFTSPQSVKAHIESTDKIVQEFVQWIKDSNFCQNEDFLRFLTRLNLEVNGWIAFNERFNSFSVDEQDIKSRSSQTIEAAFGSNCNIMKLDKGFLWRSVQTPMYKKLALSQKYLEEVSRDVLFKRIEFYDNNDPDNTDNSLLASFLKHSNVDLKDILGMMVDILMASIDTTAYATSFALYHLAKNPTVQKKLFDELTNILPNKDTVITANSLSQATYLRACIKESLRINPVAIGVGRLLSKDIVLQNYLIPKDTVIVTQNMLASRLPQYIRDPLQFRPERWIRGSSHFESIHPFLSLPFGFGPRSCIARRLAEQNIAITLAKLLRNFEVSWNHDDLGIITHLINKPDKPIYLTILPQKK